MVEKLKVIFKGGELLFVRGVFILHVTIFWDSYVVHTEKLTAMYLFLSAVYS